MIQTPVLTPTVVVWRIRDTPYDTAKNVSEMERVDSFPAPTAGRYRMSTGPGIPRAVVMPPARVPTPTAEGVPKRSVGSDSSCAGRLRKTVKATKVRIVAATMTLS